LSTEGDSGFRASAIDDLPQIWDGWGKLVRSGLGISAFGVQIMDYPAGHTTVAHTEEDTGQEELYLALRGSGEVLIGDGEERLVLDPEHVVCVEPGTNRTLEAGPEGLRVLCVGGVPGEPYREPEWTEPDSEAE
jgi:quercetin dioxygenase-like cupin family protein